MLLWVPVAIKFLLAKLVNDWRMRAERLMGCATNASEMFYRR